MSDQNKIIATPADGMTVMSVDLEQVAALEREMLDERGRQKVVPAALYKSFDQIVIAAMCVRNGIYGLATTELVEWIREQIGQLTAIEIGSGDGVLAKALGIPATDNHMQEWAAVREEYERLRQPPVRYGYHVERLDGVEAVVKYSPQALVCSWVTHKWRPEAHKRGGNMYAPDERYLLANCERLIFIGNTSAHKDHWLLRRTHKSWQYDWLYSRALRGKNFVGVWRGGK